jgi:nucleotide-binding universal stress UspA family protein
MATPGGEPAVLTRETGLRPFRKLLVPVDFSAASRAACALALRMSAQYGSEVVLFHAAGFDGNSEFLNHTGVPWGRSDTVEEAADQLRRFAEAVEPGGAHRVRVDAVRDERAVRAVVDACTRHGPSLVVLGTSARTRRRMFRSQAERIARAVACAVVFVRGEEEVPVDPDM